MANSNDTSNVAIKATIETLTQLKTLRQHLGDVESQAIAAKSLGELCFEQLDRVVGVLNDQTGLSAVLCLDALLKAICRNVELIQEAVDLAGGALLDVAVIGADGCGWLKAMLGATPDSDRDVLVWHGADQMPLPAFYAVAESCWFSKYDGSQLDDGAVTHWREIQAPQGAAA
ncbi:hypothetical protein ACEN9F_30470 [Duganella sp. CT11-25]|uniref:hypothetical protein n=1 Tax=unclassified Duganella TaxID=2636909 RepID=UPI0039AEF33A